MIPSVLVLVIPLAVVFDFHAALVGPGPRLALLLSLLLVGALLGRFGFRRGAGSGGAPRVFGGAETGLALLTPLLAWGGAMFLVHALLSWLVFRMVEKGLVMRMERLDGEGREGVALLLLLVFHGAGSFFLLQGTIVHDAFQYRAPLRSVLFDGDLDLYDQLYLRNDQRFYNPHARSTRYVGTALVHAPADLLLAAWARLRGAPSPDGGEEAHRLGVAFTSALVGFLGIVLVYRLARRFAGRRSALVATLAVWWGTELLFFQFQWVGWAHPPSWTLSAAFCLLWLRGRGRPASPMGSLLLGAVGGWAVLVRPLNGLFFLLPLFFEEGGLRARLRRGALPSTAALLLAPLPVLSLQAAVWWRAVGRIWCSPYAEVGDLFRLWSPAILDLLFSPEHHGWFFWCPVAAIAVGGLVMLARRGGRVGTAFLVLAIVQIWVLASWSVWWSGVGFGNRFFLNLAPLLAVGLAVLHAALRRGRRAFETLLFVLVVWNLHFISAYRSEAVPIGILPPIALRETRPDGPGIIGAVWRRGPALLARAWRSSWFQRNVFAEKVVLGLAAADRRAPDRLLLWLAFLAASAWALLVMRRLLDGDASRWRGAFLALLLGAPPLVAVLVLGGVGPGRELDRPWRFVMDGWILVGEEAVRLDAPRGCTVTELDLVGFCLAVNPRQGEELLRLRALEEGGAAWVVHLYGGIDAAEADALRPDLRPGMRCVLPEARIVHRRETSRLAAMPYESLGFHRRIRFPRPVALQAIELERPPKGRGDFVLTDCFGRRP